MVCLSYCDKVFIEVDLDTSIKSEIPVLEYKLRKYIEATHYFKEFYYIDIDYAMIDDSDDVHLHIWVRNKVCTESLIKLAPICTMEAVSGGECGDISYIKMSIPIRI